MFCQSLLYKNSIAHTEGTIQRLGFSLSTKFYQMFFTSILFTDLFCVNKDWDNTFLSSIFLNKFSNWACIWAAILQLLGWSLKTFSALSEISYSWDFLPCKKNRQILTRRIETAKCGLSLPKVWLLLVLISVQANQINPQPINLGECLFLLFLPNSQLYPTPQN